MNRLSTVIEVASSKTHHCTLFLCVCFSILYFINLFIYLKKLFIIISKPFGLLNIALMTANNAHPIELMHSVASYVFSCLMDTLYKC